MVKGSVLSYSKKVGFNKRHNFRLDEIEGFSRQRS